MPSMAGYFFPRAVCRGARRSAHQRTCFVALFAELLADVGYTTYPTRADFMAGLKALDAKLAPGKWLLAYDFDNLLQGGDLSMAELDAVSKDRPILIWYINIPR